LEFVDDALQSAAAAGTKSSREAGEKFRKAIETLSEYEMDCYIRQPVSDGDGGNTVNRRMEVARAKDKSSSTILNRLKESLRVREELTAAHTSSAPHSNTNFQQTEPDPTTIVEFLLHKSLPDTNPIIVKRKRRLVEFRSWHLIPVTRGTQEESDSGGNSVELQPFQGSKETPDPFAEPALLRLAAFIARRIQRQVPNLPD
jgi:hypothetical protein